MRSESGNEKPAAPAEDELSVIPGLGPVRCQALRRHGFDTLPALAAAEVTELATVPGIGPWRARRISAFARGAVAPAGTESEEPQPEPEKAGKTPAPAATPDLSETGPAWSEVIDRQREQLPETAESLFTAIREAAVQQRLRRQVARLLIIAGEFTSSGRPLPEEGRRRAVGLLTEAENELRAACSNERFSAEEQRRTASRLRRLRRALAELMAGAGDPDD